MSLKWIVCKERESQRWFVAGQTDWYEETYYPNGFSGRAKKRRVQKGYVIPKPEHISPFIEASAVVEANTESEAQCLISSWK